MNRRTFSKTALSTFFSLSALPVLSSVNATHSVRLLRHATLIVEKGNVNFLVDPMFSPKGAMDPVPNAGNDTRIPMIDLPVSKEELVGLLNKIDAVLVTHTHRDHWDAAAQEMIPKQLPIFCQATDVEKIKVDTINHCKVTRKVLSDYMTANSKKGIIAILDDGGRL